jgi:hypothetical protein
MWLCHADARQVFDLPKKLFLSFGSPTQSAVIDREIPGGVDGKSKTCRASTWHSHSPGVLH